MLRRYLLKPQSYDVFAQSPRKLYNRGSAVSAFNLLKHCAVTAAAAWGVECRLSPSYGALNLHETLLGQCTERSHIISNFFLAVVVVAEFLLQLSVCLRPDVTEQMYFHNHTRVLSQANHEAKTNLCSFIIQDQ